ncbi:hypothetical protein [Massilia yuzhufengensis]|uniref:Uncharacterized protein n=1 Tax=Massilia yuzhufengensis TaxID=1164594 RepID=A0A1I1NB28_9BURK|nr:hypothetical protein [Massilia yuzhufengensis]SFC94566.1 hypothetical protein SAMN05216204_1135 [Massilia yuzhufengensis]
MRTPIRTALGGRFSSFDALAKAMTETPISDGWPRYRSLGAKIGQLDQGKTGWWLQRPEQLRVLLDLLGLSGPDVGIHPDAFDGLFAFSDFPELPPLDARRERFCDIAGPGPLPRDRDRAELDLWLEDRPRSLHRMPTSTVWLHVPPRTGRSVLLATLTSTGRYEVLVKNTLADVGELLAGAEPIVIAVSADGGMLDLLALARRPEDAGTLIIAPFAAPSRRDADPLEDWSWEGMTGEKLDRQLLGMTNPGSLRSAIQPVQWQLHSGWRQKLLNWVEARLSRHDSDTLFSSTSLGEWLDSFDPLQEWIRTPADLMALCRVTHHGLEKRLPDRGMRNAGQQLLTAMPLSGPGEEALFARLACARWEDFTQPWRNALPYAAWEGLAPAPPSRVDLLAIAEESDMDERYRQVTRLARQPDTAGLRLLSGAGLLARSSNGCFDLEPRVLADLAVRDHLLVTMTSGRVDKWGMACFDPERRATVDAALDALDDGDLLAAVEGVLHRGFQSAAGLAAAEALFCTVGRRKLQGRQVPDGVHALASAVVPHLPLGVDGWTLPGPWTRPLSMPAECCEWLAVCWAWSLSPKPEMPALAGYAGWLFAGWCDDLPETPFWLRSLTPPSEGSTYIDAWTSVLKAAQAVVRHRTVLVDDPPSLWHGALLAASIYGAWPAQAVWWEAVHADETMTEILLTQLKHHGSAGATNVWPSLIAHEAEAISTGQIRAMFSPVRIAILEQLDAAVTVKGLGLQERRYAVRNAQLMPPKVRRMLLDSLAPEELEEDIQSADRLFKACGREAVASLVRWLDTTIGWFAASQMWEHNPEFTIQWIEAHAATNAELAEMVLDACPQSESARAAGVLLRDRTLLDFGARQDWVRNRLPGSGMAATVLVALLEQSGSRNDRA